MEQLKVGLQLYGIRDAMQENLPDALEKVKAMGYDYVEMAGGRYGLSGSEMKEAIESCGLKCVSVHQSPKIFQDDAKDALRYVKEMGAEYAVIPMATNREAAFLEHWDETVSLYTEMGSAFREIGVKLLYHNHSFEFLHLPEDEEYIFDRLLQAVPSDLLSPEIDTCWVSFGGVNPVDKIRQYAHRLHVVHLKDYTCKAPEEKPVWQLMEEGKLSSVPKRSEVSFRYVPVGYGVHDWAPILDAVKASAAEYVVVEQDESKDRSTLEAAEMSRRYLKEKFGL